MRKKNVTHTLNGDCAILDATSKCSVDRERDKFPCKDLGPLPENQTHYCTLK